MTEQPVLGSNAPGESVEMSLRRGLHSRTRKIDQLAACPGNPINQAARVLEGFLRPEANSPPRYRYIWSQQLLCPTTSFLSPTALATLSSRDAKPLILSDLSLGSTTPGSRLGNDEGGAQSLTLPRKLQRNLIGLSVLPRTDPDLARGFKQWQSYWRRSLAVFSKTARRNTAGCPRAAVYP
ncbi:hypothetical protein VTI74DRAFT_2086 [Chaetomium olivicolor]